MEAMGEHEVIGVDRGKLTSLLRFKCSKPIFSKEMK